jgi:hypothetical protein
MMRKILKALPILVAVLAASASTAAAARTAPVRTLKPHEVASWVRWLGATDDTHVAYGRIPTDGSATADTQMVVRPDAGTSATFAPPPGCTSTAAGGGRVLFGCGWDDVGQSTAVEHVAVMSATGAELTRTSMPGGGGLTAIGEQWIEVPRGTDGNWTTPARMTLLNWHTGETRDVDPTDPATVLDLDADTGVSPLCSGVRAVPRRPEMRPFGLSDLPVVVRAPYALVTTDDGIVGDPASGRVVFSGEHTALHRCGSPKPIALPKPFARGAVLGYGWVATAAEHDGRAVTDLVRLSDRRRFTVPMPGVATFTRGRLYLMNRPGKYPTDPVIGSVSTVQLPRK